MPYQRSGRFQLTRFGQQRGSKHEFLPALGLHEAGTWPEHLLRFQDLGIQSWQCPSQFSRYLANLSGRRIDSYLELGISHGGTFIITSEYLRRFNSSVPAVGIDTEIKAGVKYYESGCPNWTRRG
jgi:cephalosporin hydroxylase